MARKDNLSKLIREEWPAKLDAELKKRYSVECQTCWNSRVIQGQFETSRIDGWPLSPEMISFIHGYMIAMNHVYIWNGRV